MARPRSGDDDHDVLKIALLAALVTATACTGTWGAPGHSRTTRHVLTAGYATSTALVSCDVGQTIWASHGGRWDRMSRPGFKMAEMNPLLGQEPPPVLLATFAVVNAVAGYVLIEAPLPAWVKGLWFGGVTAVETAMVVGNYQFSGACGLADTRYAGFEARQ